MVTAVRVAARHAGVPEEVMGNFLTLVDSVKKAVYKEQPGSSGQVHCLGPEDLFDSLIAEYDQKL